VLPHVGNLGRVFFDCVVTVWLETGDQYIKMLHQKQGMEGTCERVVREQTAALIRSIEPTCPLEGHAALPADLRWTRAQFLREGLEGHIRLSLEALNEISSESHSHGLAPLLSGNRKGQKGRGSEGATPAQETVPFYESYWRLMIAISAQSALSAQTLENGQGFLVKGKQRQQLLEYGEKLRARSERLRACVQSSLGVAAPVDDNGDVDMVRALLELDRIRRRRIRFPRGFNVDQDLPMSYKESVAYAQRKVEQSSWLNKSSSSAHSTKTEDESQPRNSASSKMALTDMPAGDGFEEEEEEEEQEEEVECVCCFEEPAEFVFKNCGHLTYCKTCRNKALKRAANGKFRVSDALCCPLCRTESSVVPQSVYSGRVYK